MQAVCGLDCETTMTRKYSTTMENQSTITNIEDECQIALSRFTKRVKDRDVRYIQATATLLDDTVDEAHDLFYLVQMPEGASQTTVGLTAGVLGSSEKVERKNTCDTLSVVPNGLLLPQESHIMVYGSFGQVFQKPSEEDLAKSAENNRLKARRRQ